LKAAELMMNGSNQIHDEQIQVLADHFYEAAIIIQDDFIVHSNHANALMHGFDSASEIIGNTIFSAVQEKEREKLAMIHEKSKVGMNTGIHSKWNLKRRDGRLFQVKTHPNYITWKDQPALLNIVQNLSASNEEKKEFLEKIQKSISPRTVIDRHGCPLHIIGKSPAMRRLYGMIVKAAMTDANVLILGESGSGKEAVARLIHDISNRYHGSFISLNCTAINDNLFESAFFGHKKGTFTGALYDKIGFLRAADKGTLFLDEICELSLEAQKKLLRVFDRGEYTPVGSINPRISNARIIMASNKDPVRLVEEGLMREDFFYRIYVIVLEVPPLRERQEDLPSLIECFLEQSQYVGTPMELPGKVMKSFLNYHWPGNVRELQNAITRYLTLGEHDFLCPIRKPVLGKALSNSRRINKRERASDRVNLRSALEELEKKMILNALTQTGGNKSRAAKYLQIPRRTFLRKLETYRIT
jgi:PAS domain S-box-containing protein